MATDAPRRHALLAAALGMALASDAGALGWDLAASVTGTTTLSDNGRQSSSGGGGGTSATVGVRPSISATSTGSSRVRISANYALDASERFDSGGGNSNSGRDQLRHNLNSSLNAEVVDDFFFIDASARVSQQLLSLLSAPSSDSGDRNNQTTVGSYSVTPSLVRRFGNFATGTARYTVGGVLFEDSNQGNNANTGAFDASLASGTRFNDLNWLLSYSLRDASNRGGAADSTFERYSATLGYALTRKFRVFATVGQENNDFQQTADISGESYSAGFGWTPNQRTQLEVSAGERFFGKTFSASGSYSTRRTSWNLSYIEDVSDLTERLTDGTLYWECPVGGQIIASPVRPPSCTEDQESLSLDDYLQAVREGRADINDFGLARGVFIFKSLTAGVGWTIGPRLSVSGSVGESRRQFLAQNDREDLSRRFSLSASYRLRQATTLTGSLGFSQFEVPPGLEGENNLIARDDEVLSLTASLSHRFARDLRGNMSLRHTQRDSNDATATYDENSLTASITYDF